MMTKYARIATELDAKDGDVVELAWAYELAIQEPDASAIMFLNLVAIYFECEDPGFSASKQVPLAFGDAAYERALEVLDLATVKHGALPEIEFWRLHLRERMLGEKISDDAYLDIANRDSSSLNLAYVALYANSNATKYQNEASKLISGARTRQTQRLRYIASFGLPTEIPR
jgi:hypothetical protein